jgi:ketosteroid isomerase-like protein
MKITEFDSCLNGLERRNVAAAYEMIAAVQKCWFERKAGCLHLKRLLAEDFISFTPTSDPDRQQRLDKRAFVDCIRDQGPRLTSDSRLEIVAHTAHGNRVATEMLSELVREDGSAVRNRYHQLFLFDSAGMIQEYRTYMDSAAIVDSAIARGEALIRSFVAALGSASPDLKKITDKHFAYFPADCSGAVGTDLLLAKVAAIRDKLGKFSLDVVHEGLVVEQGVASVEVQAGDGFVHSLVIKFDDDYVTSAIEFSSGILESHL